ncbi:MAG: MarR family winged helix-turn-helix transcriptional regulator [Pseudomonadota bacterium]
MTNKPADGLGTQVRRLLELLDQDVEAIYREAHPTYTPRFTPIMKALVESNEITITEIAAHSSVSHSAASQTVSRMTSLGLVELKAAADGRQRLVSLTDEGRALIPWLKQRWAATQAAAAELDAQLTHPLSSVLREAIQLLADKPFKERINEQNRQS